VADRCRRFSQSMISEQFIHRERIMTKVEHMIRAATVCLVVLFLAVPPAAAQSPQSTLPLPAPSVAKKSHRLILQVNTNDPATMNLALNNATNVEQYYKGVGEKVEIEVVTFGPGLHMLRNDTSPVKERIKTIAEKMPSISFKACGNTRENMTKVEEKEIPLIPQATVVKSGVVRVMELQEQGWSYLRP
jgi:intracellular sulfur oxidation DsrE/DsrF family protein